MQGFMFFRLVELTYLQKSGSFSRKILYAGFEEQRPFRRVPRRRCPRLKAIASYQFSQWKQPIIAREPQIRQQRRGSERKILKNMRRHSKPERLGWLTEGIARKIARLSVPALQVFSAKSGIRQRNQKI
jgi:hypothetical protein